MPPISFINCSVSTIAKGCNLFNMKPIMQGFMPKPGITLFGNVTLWFPIIQNDYWNNCPSTAGSFDVIYESSKDPMKNARQIRKYVGKGEVRVTFLKDNVNFPDGKYHFVGIYKLDVDETITSGSTDESRVCVWKQECKECDTDLKVLEDMLKKLSLI